MDSQQQYEALLAQWGFDTESQNTAHKFYEFGKRNSVLLSKLISKLTASFKVKQENFQLGLSH